MTPLTWTPPPAEVPSELSAVLKQAWHRFLDTYEPLRPELYRYCRQLTRSPWDADDLVQDVLSRAFVTLGSMDPPEPNAPDTSVLDAFCDAFNARDLDRLTGLLLDTASVEVVRITTQYGRDAARRTVLPGMLFGSRRLAEAHLKGGIDPRYQAGVRATLPRGEVRQHRGEALLLSWYEHEDGEAVRAITRLESDGASVARLRNYFYTPDVLAEICAELGVPFRANGYRPWYPSDLLA
jgi:RNA polymerase sigma-70 factor (ECF subfamily)